MTRTAPSATCAPSAEGLAHPLRRFGENIQGSDAGARDQGSVDASCIAGQKSQTRLRASTRKTHAGGRCNINFLVTTSTVRKAVHNVIHESRKYSVE